MRIRLSEHMPTSIASLVVTTTFCLVCALPFVIPRSIADSLATPWTSDIPDARPETIEQLRRRLGEFVHHEEAIAKRGAGDLAETGDRPGVDFFVGYARTAAALYLAETMAGRPIQRTLVQASHAARRAKSYGPDRTSLMLAIAFEHLAEALLRQDRLEEALPWQEASAHWNAALSPT